LVRSLEGWPLGRSGEPAPEWEDEPALARASRKDAPLAPLGRGVGGEECLSPLSSLGRGQTRRWRPEKLAAPATGNVDKETMKPEERPREFKTGPGSGLVISYGKKKP
jgi:hypothetical protein